MSVVDLTINRNLLCPNFDSYKLSFEPVPVMRQSFDRNPLRLEPHANQYSLLHVELFARHNLLFSDPWARNNCYYINLDHQLVLCSYDEQRGQPRTQRIVHDILRRDHGEGYEHRIGDYNYTLRFISEKYCVLCDGMLTYYLLHTGDRLRATTWELVTRAPIADGDPQRAFVLLDARLDIVQERKQISLVAGHVAKRSSAISKERDVHVMQLVWARWTLKKTPNAIWEYKKCIQLETRGSIYYCAFEPRAESLVLCSTSEIQTEEQREQAESEAIAALTAAPAAQLQNGQEESVESLSWSQTAEEVLVCLVLPEGVVSGDLNVKCRSSQLLVECPSQTLLNGELFASVELASWAVDTSLRVRLSKSEVQHWPRLLDSQEAPPEKLQMDSDLDLEDEPEQLPIPNLEDPIEDCDFPPDFNSDDIKIVRFHLPTSAITHTIHLGNAPPLFASTLRAGFPAAFVTRQGVDASVWLQHYQPDRAQEWTVRHEGNLNAFGYVQASKQQRKFVDCCPELDYAVISESIRHVFIYKQHYDTADGLRNRNGPQVVIGKQSLVTLDDDVGEVIGMATAPSVIILLTEHAVLYLQI